MKKENLLDIPKIKTLQKSSMLKNVNDLKNKSGHKSEPDYIIPDDLKSLKDNILIYSEPTGKYFKDDGNNNWYEFFHHLTSRMYYMTQKIKKRRWGRPNLQILDETVLNALGKPVKGGKEPISKRDVNNIKLYKSDKKNFFKNPRFEISKSLNMTDFYIGTNSLITFICKESDINPKIKELTWPGGEKYDYLRLIEMINNNSGIPGFLFLNKTYFKYEDFIKNYLNNLGDKWNLYDDDEKHKLLKEKNIKLEGEIVPDDITWYYEYNITDDQILYNKKQIQNLQQLQLKQQNAATTQQKSNGPNNLNDYGAVGSLDFSFLSEYVLNKSKSLKPQKSKNKKSKSLKSKSPKSKNKKTPRRTPRRTPGEHKYCKRCDGIGYLICPKCKGIGDIGCKQENKPLFEPFLDTGKMIKFGIRMKTNKSDCKVCPKCLKYREILKPGVIPCPKCTF